MENKIMLSKQSSPEQVKAYFTVVLNLSHSNKEFPVDFDEVWQLVYAAKNKAVEELKGKFLQDVDYQLINQKVQAANPQGYVWEHKYYLTTSCLESLLRTFFYPIVIYIINNITFVKKTIHQQP